MTVVVGANSVEHERSECETRFATGDSNTQLNTICSTRERMMTQVEGMGVMKALIRQEASQTIEARETCFG